MTVKSPALRRRGDISLYVPPQVEKDGCDALLILLNGVYNSHWGWLYHAGVHLTAQRLILSGAIRSMVLAMPSDGLWGDGSAYVAHGREDVERWIMEDTREAALLAVPQLQRTAKLFLAGLSMGGYGALLLGGKWANAVSGISAHSAITQISEMQFFVEEPLEDYMAQGVNQLDPLYWLQRNSSARPALRMDCGLEDSLIVANRDFHQSLVKAGIEHSYQENPGGHNWQYWEKHVEDTLLFCESQMKLLERTG